MKDVKKKSKRKYVIILVAVLAYIITGLVNPLAVVPALEMLGGFLLEMVSILPFVLILSNLLMAWVPRKLVLRSLGPEAGLRGKLFALFVGSFSAGPIYAAFPLTQALQKKGASISNITIILSSWAVIKVPLLIVEAQFLGLDFMLLRFAITLPIIFVIAFILEKTVKPKDLSHGLEEEEELNQRSNEILVQLPNYNCKVCGYESCLEFSKAVASEKAELKDCVLKRG
jgi:uncharacterized membrane protein YraQ (UPF0718 family)